MGNPVRVRPGKSTRGLCKAPVAPPGGAEGSKEGQMSKGTIRGPRPYSWVKAKGSTRTWAVRAVGRPLDKETGV